MNTETPSHRNVQEDSNMASDVSNCELERRQRAAVVMVVLVVGAALLATVYGLSMTAAVLASWITGR